MFSTAAIISAAVPAYLDMREWIQTSLLKSRVRFVPKAVAGQGRQAVPGVSLTL
jgi:hypothetical protein